jgi:ABC-2 type transport system ATP-binding protein
MIEVRGLTKDYGAFRAVDDLSFQVKDGEVVGFLGPNGAGKTTTIRVLTCFHPATSGTVLINGLDVVQDSLSIRSTLGYLPEQIPLYGDLRVQEYLRYRAGLKGLRGKEGRRQVEAVMDAAGVTEMRRKLCSQVSRGYRQRVGLADALLASPKLLILDEPTSGLDPNQRRKVRDLVRSLKEQHTILFSSHILSDVEDVCDRILLIHQGKLRADGSLEELNLELGREELQFRVQAPVSEVRALLQALLPEARGSLQEEGGWTRASYMLPSQKAVDSDALCVALGKAFLAKAYPLAELFIHRPSLEETFFALTQDKEGGGGQPARVAVGNDSRDGESPGVLEEGSE